MRPVINDQVKAAIEAAAQALLAVIEIDGTSSGERVAIDALEGSGLYYAIQGTYQSYD